MRIKKEGYLIEIYQEKNGKAPLVEWLDSVGDINIRARIRNRLSRIEIGNFGDYKHLKSGLYELRLCFGQGYRIYFGKIGGMVVLLLHGDSKGTQKKDIEKAYKYWKDFKNN